MALLEIKRLTIEYQTEEGPVPVADRLNLRLEKGQILGLSGPSGSGKTSLALAILRVLPKPGKVQSGQILFDGVDLLQLPDCEMRRLRSSRIAIVFQEPATALNPLLRIEDQLSEVIHSHGRSPTAEARERSAQLLGQAGIAEVGRCMEAYPHQLSGGQRQRVLVAIALANDPDLLLCDEPTSALDPYLQLQILELLRAERLKRNLAILLISHDLHTAAFLADELVELKSGRLLPIRTEKETSERH